MLTYSRRELLKRAGTLAASSAIASALPNVVRGESSAAGRPNILFLFPDQHRFDWTGMNKALTVRTPNFNQLCARGTTFSKAVVAAPLCAPSRACLAAGKEYDRCGVPSNGANYPLEQITYYKLLRDSGYHVMGCGKFDLHKNTQDWGLDGKRLLPEWGFSDGVDNAGKGDAIASWHHAKGPKDPYMNFLKQKNLAQGHLDDFRHREGGTKSSYGYTQPTPLPDEAYCDNWLAGNGLSLLDKAPKEKPWFLMVNWTGPHPPMDITQSMEGRVRSLEFPQPNQNTELPAAMHEAIRQNYTAMIENIDRWIGTYLDKLKVRGELENTIIVYASDHGEMLGDHDQWGKTKPWHPSASVPMVACGPGVRQNVVYDGPTTVMDLAATYLDYAGVPTPSSMDSKSMRPLLEGKIASHRDCVLSGLGKWRLVYDGRYKLIRGFGAHHGAGGKGDLLLFDHQTDPLENENIAEKSPEIVARLEPRLPKEV